MTLEVHNLAFGYPGKPVGREAGFRISAGEVVCLLGRILLVHVLPHLLP
jgi:ABC-type cobalamin/Fe3+-siderophores transport system ATPase subunit